MDQAIQLEVNNFPSQQSIFDHPSKFKIAVKGRRFGLTKGAANDFIQGALKKTFSKGLWVDTVNSNIERYVERYFLPKINKLPQAMWNWRKQQKILELNGSYIDFRSIDNPENLEGFGYDKAFLNEAGIILKSEYLWNNAIKPMFWDFPNVRVVIGGCIESDSLVLSNGIREIGSFSTNRETDKYVSISKNIIGFGKNLATDFYSNGVSETITIKTLGGYSLTGTHNHKIWTDSGWKELETITEMDKIGIFFGQNEWGDYKPNYKYVTNKNYRHINPVLNEDTAYLCGYLLGDGSIDHKRISVNFHKDDANLIVFLKNLGFDFSPKRDDQMRLNSREYVEFFNFLGLDQKRAKYKTIPDGIIRCRKEIVVEFLRGLFDADGCARSTGNVTFASTSEKLIKQVMVILLNFGIVSSYSGGVAPAHTGSRGFVRDSVLFTIHLNKYNSNLYGELIGFRLKRKQDKITKSTTDRYRTGKKDNGIFWTTMASKKTSKAYTCDFVIPKTHSYISNGFMSHNTPKGKGIFHELFERGNDPAQQNYHSFHFTSFDSPFSHIHQAIKEDMASMPEHVIRQEIFAEFMDDNGTVFRGVDKIATELPGKPISGRHYVIGVDLAKVQDWTVLAVFDRSTNAQVYQDRFNKLEWPYQKTKIIELSRFYNNALCIIDATGIGDPICDDLLRAGVAVEPVKLTNEIKKEIIEKLSIWIEQEKIRILDIPDSVRELKNFTYDISSTGRVRYEAPAGFHDDIVISMALACRSLAPLVKIIETPPSIIRQQYAKAVRRNQQFDEGYYEGI